MKLGLRAKGIIFLFLSGLLLSFSALAAAEENSLAVFEFESPTLDDGVVSALTSLLRQEARGTQKYNLVTPGLRRSEIELVLGCQAEELSCLREIAAFAETDAVLLGTITEEGGFFTLHVDFVHRSSRVEPIHFRRRYPANEDPVAAFRQDAPLIFEPEAFVQPRAPLVHEAQETYQPAPRTTTEAIEEPREALFPEALLPESLEERRPAELAIQARRRSNGGAFSLIGVGLLAAGGAGGMVFLMRDIENQIGEENAAGTMTPIRYQELTNRGESYETAQYVLFGASALCLTAGLTWLVWNTVDYRRNSKSSGFSSLRIDPVHRSLVLEGRF